MPHQPISDNSSDKNETMQVIRESAKRSKSKHCTNFYDRATTSTKNADETPPI